MPRQARRKSGTGVYHIMLRGVNKQPVFLDDKDRMQFLKTIQRFQVNSKCTLYGFCLMENHIHLLLKEEEDFISDVVKRISSSYVFWFNQKYDRCGHLFQERYKSEIVDDEAYLLTVLRYIHQNPVKAGIVKNVHEYRWSSYREYIGKAIISNTDFIKGIYSHDNDEATRIFVEFTNQQQKDDCLEDKEKAHLTDLQLLEHLNHFGIVDAHSLQQIEKTKRNDILRKLKMIEGVSIRKLSKLTGVPKSTINRL